MRFSSLAVKIEHFLDEFLIAGGILSGSTINFEGWQSTTGRKTAGKPEASNRQALYEDS
jgi:hypothetical protein